MSLIRSAVTPMAVTAPPALLGGKKGGFGLAGCPRECCRNGRETRGREGERERGREGERRGKEG